MRQLADDGCLRCRSGTRQEFRPISLVQTESLDDFRYCVDDHRRALAHRSPRGSMLCTKFRQTRFGTLRFFVLWKLLDDLFVAVLCLIHVA